MHVPFLDIPAQNRSLEPELSAAVAAVIEDGRFILGPAVEQFEADFANYVGVRHCVGLNNGTSALHMALLACGVGPGDEVITTPLTWISTSWAITYTGARPVFVDVDPRTFTLDPAAVERAITPRTKAILPVHLYGQLADMTALGEIAQRRGLTLIEDAAQAHGARWSGRMAGSLGRIGCFSFYPGKNLGAFGEAGAITTDDDALAARIRRLRDHAQETRHHHVELGFNTRMEGLQGAVLQVKLKRLDAWNARRASLAALYEHLLEGLPGLQTPAAVRPEAHAWHLYVVLCHGRQRDEVRCRLQDLGVAAAVHYPTLVPLQPAYAHLGYTRVDFPIAADIAEHCLSLPLFPEMTEEQAGYVAFQLHSIFETAPLCSTGAVRPCRTNTVLEQKVV